MFPVDSPWKHRQPMVLLPGSTTSSSHWVYRSAPAAHGFGFKNCWRKGRKEGALVSLVPMRQLVFVDGEVVVTLSFLRLCWMAIGWAIHGYPDSATNLRRIRAAPVWMRLIYGNSVLELFRCLEDGRMSSRSGLCHLWLWGSGGSGGSLLINH